MISIQKKFLFIHIPKTGGNSVQNILRKYSEDKIVTVADHQDGIERFEVRNEKYNIHKHSTLNDYRKELKPYIYDQLYKFSIIRNPWERMVSFYYSPNRKVSEWNRNDFIKLLNRAKPIGEYITTTPPHQYPSRHFFRKLLPKKNKSTLSEIDFLIRFEHLHEDFKSVCQIIDIPFEPLPHRNKSNRKHYTYYYDEELKKMIELKFKDEIEFGNYQFK